MTESSSTRGPSGALAATSSPPPRGTVLLTGATGFVGGHVYPPLAAAGFAVRCASRRPARARARHPERTWVRLDLEDLDTLAPALEGCEAVIYLVHAMKEDGDYALRERAEALAFARAAERAGVRRVVYLGGPAAMGSRHLHSRYDTGRILRESAFTCFELRAAMLIGAGSESWRIARDLALRLPALVVSDALDGKSAPVDVRDVARALAGALSLDDAYAGVYSAPGPEELSTSDILRRVARLAGRRAAFARAPYLSTRFARAGVRAFTRADRRVAHELIAGLACDLRAVEPEIWPLLDDVERTPFDVAVRRALLEESRSVPFFARTAERLLGAAERRVRARVDRWFSRSA